MFDRVLSHPEDAIVVVSQSWLKAPPRVRISREGLMEYFRQTTHKAYCLCSINGLITNEEGFVRCGGRCPKRVMELFASGSGQA